MSIRRWIRLLLPPLVVREARKWVSFPGDIVFRGDYPDWESASADCTGYDDQAILAKVIEATRAVVRGDATYERDGQLFNRTEYSWPLLASLLKVAANQRSLRVIDFGGSLGTTLRQNQRFLRDLPGPLSWKVVEQQQFVEAGQREFQSDPLSFHSTIADAAAGGVDVVLVAGVLNHIDDPQSVMQQIAQTSAPYLIIDRTMIAPGERDIIAVQEVPARIYAARYAVRKFSRRSFQSLLAGWTLIEEWDCELQPDPQSTSVGGFYKRA